jgi:hypothetical protein
VLDDVALSGLLWYIKAGLTLPFFTGLRSVKKDLDLAFRTCRSISCLMVHYGVRGDFAPSGLGWGCNNFTGLRPVLDDVALSGLLWYIKAGLTLPFFTWLRSVLKDLDLAFRTWRSISCLMVRYGVRGDFAPSGLGWGCNNFTGLRPVLDDVALSGLVWFIKAELTLPFFTWLRSVLKDLDLAFRTWRSISCLNGTLRR